MGDGIATFVMLELDVVDLETGRVRDVVELRRNLQALKAIGVAGVMLDVWWGIVERRSPRHYDWAGYLDALREIRRAGLLAQVVLSFHAAGGNVGDTVNIPLPDWVRACAAQEPSLFAREADGFSSEEYISIGADDEPLLAGRTPVQAYRDFMDAFVGAFRSLLGSTIVEVEVGLGPCGELRYPSYVPSRWQFPGIGAIACSDRFLLARWEDFVTNSSLCRKYLQQQQCTAAEAKAALPRIAAALGPASGHATASEFFGGGDDAALHGAHRTREDADADAEDLQASLQVMRPPSATAGAQRPQGLRYDRGIGRLFLRWYARELLRHADAVLREARAAFGSLHLHALSPVPRSTPAAAVSPGRGSFPDEPIMHDDPFHAGSVPPARAHSGVQDRDGRSEPGTVHLGVKVPGIHWWRGHHSRAAEELAGFSPSVDADDVPSNVLHRLHPELPCDGTLTELARPHLASRYWALCRLLAHHGVRMCFTCMELSTTGHAQVGAACEPKQLVREVRAVAAANALPVTGENALHSLEERDLQHVLAHCYDLRLPGLHTFTFLRISPEMTQPGPQRSTFAAFVRCMRECTLEERRRRKGIAPPLSGVCVPLAAPRCVADSNEEPRATSATTLVLAAAIVVGAALVLSALRRRAATGGQ